METTTAATIADTYVDFEPYCAWQRDEQSYTIAIHLHGFQKEQLRVQINNERIVTISGQRLVDEGTKTWSRFTKQLKLPEDCTDYGIRARFSAGVLTITMPKKLSFPSPHQDHDSPIITTPQPHDQNLHQRSRSDDDNIDEHQQQKSCRTTQPAKLSSSSSSSQNNNSSNKNKNSSVFRFAATVAAVVLVLAVSGANYVYKHPSSSSSTPTN
ncbi:hypothetical protein F8388_004821 [Cannabis sativa]|uniref:SHSP domain-containing protein n=1 Tax=Cannabis sativa TaxID=3483 RepID=A0A7J6HNN8_CANSA|nr:hypothetical protein F8388_004821 [Cannabis sativa]